MSNAATAERLDSNAPPKGFKQVSGDINAYWESASPGSRNSDPKEGSGPVLFTPLHVTLSDSDIEATKTSTLLHARLEAPCVLRSANKDEGYKEFAKGTLFGIWTKPGMRELAELGGCVVWMRNGQEINKEIVKFKEIGKPSPMVLFDIRSDKEKGTKLPIKQDNRDKSLPEALRNKRAQAAAEVAEEMGDIPF